MRPRQLCAAVVLAAAVLAFAPVVPGARAAETAPDPGLQVRYDETTGLPRVVTHRSGYLTGANAGDLGQVALAWLADHADLFQVDGDELGTFSAREAPRSEHNGATHVNVVQQVAGIDVMGATLSFAFDGAGRLVLVGGEYLADPPAPGEPAITAEDAVRVAVADSGGDASAAMSEESVEDDTHTFENNSAEGLDEPADLVAELVVFPVSADESRLAWRTEVEVAADEWNEVVVDAVSGRILDRRSLYTHLGPEGTVHTGQHPEDSGPPQVVPFTGWVSGTSTIGNNVTAYEDRDADNAPDAGSSPNAADTHFNYSWTDAFVTSGGTNAGIGPDRDFSVTQMFYYTNLLHDFLYGLGFTEQFRNFQVDNFGNGGSGGDPVLAEARDGWGTGTELLCKNDDNDDIRCRNNANFGTPTDGNSPRMQMYLWTTPADGTVDGDVIAHEYGHGLSKRLVGNGDMGSGKQTGSLGEGWSDTVSFMLWDDSVIGEYVTGDDTSGVRSVDYDTSNLTYDDFTNANGVHANGEIWATTLYNVLEELRARYGNASGMAEFRQLVVDGMKSTITSPTMVDARDGILAADILTNAGANQCLLWVQFAERDLGVAASGTATTATADHTVPPQCVPNADAGGPYSTAEGMAVTLDGTGSTPALDPTGGPLSYAWDLDNDGQYDDSTSPTPSFQLVGDNAVRTVGLEVRNQAGATDTDAANVTVTNVAPAAAIDGAQLTALDEGGTLSVAASYSDAGWLDTHEATIDWGTGDPAEPVTPTVTTPGSLGTPRAGSIAGSHDYGDNGTFTVTVTVTDDDGAVDSASFDVTVSNVNPTAAIDETGAVDVNGVKTKFAHAGESVPFAAGVTDPGSDDLTVAWDWDDGAPSPDESETSLVNPPLPDGSPSPSVEARDETFSTSHTFDDACMYDVTATATDDDGGSDVDGIAVIITGNTSATRGKGYWYNQFRTPGARNQNDLSDATLSCFLAIARHYSAVFSEARAVDTQPQATLALAGPSSNPKDQLDGQLLAAWMNFASGALDPAEMVDTNGDGTLDTTFLAAVTNAETVRLDPAATASALRAEKEKLERINTRDE